MALHEQEALYRAQNESLYSWGRSFTSIEDVANYLANLINTEWFFNQFGVCPDIKVVEWKSHNRWAGCVIKDKFTLVLKPGIIQESVVLHELAHLLCDDNGHGECFARTQLILVRQQMGFPAYAEYRHELLKTGVFNNV